MPATNPVEKKAPQKGSGTGKIKEKKQKYLLSAIAKAKEHRQLRLKRTYRQKFFNVFARSPGKRTKKTYEFPNKNLPKLKKTLTPGTVVMILKGKHSGRKAIFLKQLERTGMILIMGPKRLSGVPLKRIDQCYVIGSQTKLDISDIKIDPILDDGFFDSPKKKYLMQRIKESRIPRNSEEFFKLKADKKAARKVRVDKAKKKIAEKKAKLETRKPLTDEEKKAREERRKAKKDAVAAKQKEKKPAPKKAAKDASAQKVKGGPYKKSVAKKNTMPHHAAVQNLEAALLAKVRKTKLLSTYMKTLFSIAGLRPHEIVY